MEVDKIIAFHESVNPASGRIKQKAGMNNDATLPKYFIDKNTEPRDEHLDIFVFFDEKEYENFITETSDFIYEMLHEKMEK